MPEHRLLPGALKCLEDVDILLVRGGSLKINITSTLFD